jgi:hypothetical protein
VTDVTDVTGKNQKGKSDWISLPSHRDSETLFFQPNSKTTRHSVTSVTMAIISTS